MKAIRSLEQHVDSLMSYDFTDLTDDELIDQLKKVDDMRMWRIAEACRQRNLLRSDPRDYKRLMSGLSINLRSSQRWKQL